MSKRLLTIAVFILCLVLDPLICDPIFAAQFSKKEKKALQLIEEVKVFERKYGLVETKNFIIFKEKEDQYNLLFYQEKTVTPFCYMDPLMKFKSCKYDTLKANLPLLAKEGITEEKYDLYFYVCGGASNGTIVTRKILNYDDEDLACLVFHEDTHDTLNLPINMEEAAAKIIGLVGSLKFTEQERDIKWRLNFDRIIAVDLDNCHKKLTELSESYAKGEITLNDYMKQKKEAIDKCYLSQYEFMANAASICQNHTYLHYHNFLYYLFVALHRDLEKFVKVLKDAAELYPEPTELLKENGEGADLYFKETRRREILIEKYILKVIVESD